MSGASRLSPALPQPGIQGEGGALVKGVAGGYDNVVGLPVKRLLKEFSEIFEAAM